MASHKVRIHTDKGDFIVEMENPADSPEGQKQSAQADEDIKRYRSLGVPTDELGKPTRPLTMGERANDAILHPTPGMQLAGDTAGLLMGFAGPKLSAAPPENVRVNPGKIADFKINQPFKTLKDFFTVGEPSQLSRGERESFSIRQPKAASTPPTVNTGQDVVGRNLREPASLADPYMPNISTATGPMRPAVSHRVPYSPPNESFDSRVSGLPPPQITGKAPNLEDVLTQVIDQIRAEHAGPEVSTSAPPIETAGGGPLRQSGTFGKSGSAGQPGGYSSGIPGRSPMSDAEFQKLLERMGFGPKSSGPGGGAGSAGDSSPVGEASPPAAGSPRYTESLRNTEPPVPFKSGAVPGSAEAHQASVLHAEERMLDQLYQMMKGDSRK